MGQFWKPIWLIGGSLLHADSQTVAVRLTPQKEKEFLQAMLTLKEDRKEVTGLQDLKVCQDREDATHFEVVYKWEEEEDLKNYLETEHFKVFLGALDVLCQEYEIRCGAFPDLMLKPCSSQRFDAAG